MTMILDCHPDDPRETHAVRGCKAIGYWRAYPDKHATGTLFLENDIWSNYVVKTAHLPDPHDFVDHSWDLTIRDRVVRYLESGRVAIRWRGYSTCRICGKWNNGKWNNGTTCITDDTYVWPEGFAHYIAEHGVRPDEEFVQHVLAQPMPEPRRCAPGTPHTRNTSHSYKRGDLFRRKK